MFTKDPDAYLDYQVDWTRWLEGIEDTIQAVTWLVPNGLVKESESNTTTTATVWLSGGEAGQSYDVVCRITTANGRIDDRTLNIIVKER